MLAVAVKELQLEQKKVSRGMSLRRCLLRLRILKVT